MAERLVSIQYVFAILLYYKFTKKVKRKEEKQAN